MLFASSATYPSLGPGDRQFTGSKTEDCYLLMLVSPEVIVTREVVERMSPGVRVSTTAF